MWNVCLVSVFVSFSQRWVDYMKKIDFKKYISSCKMGWLWTPWLTLIDVSYKVNRINENVQLPNHFWASSINRSANDQSLLQITCHRYILKLSLLDTNVVVTVQFSPSKPFWPEKWRKSFDWRLVLFIYFCQSIVEFIRYILTTLFEDHQSQEAWNVCLYYNFVVLHSKHSAWQHLLTHSNPS